MMERIIGVGITERQARQVFASVGGIVHLARRLGVSDPTAARWARELGVEVRPHVAPRKPAEQKFTDAQCREAIDGPQSLHHAAWALGVTAPALIRRARLLELPTSRAGRAALRDGRMAA